MCKWVRVAELSKAKTTKGGLVARSAGGLAFSLREGLEIAFVPPRHEAPRRALVESVTKEGTGRWLVAFSGVETRAAAERLVGCSCLARRRDLPLDALAAPLEAFCGFEVHDCRSGYVGIVASIIDKPAQRLLCVDRPGGRAPVLVPLVDAFVVELSEEGRRIDMDLPSGLLDL